MSMGARWQPVILSALGFLGVALGAFGSHALKGSVSEADLEIWKTAVLYLFCHTLMGYLSFVRFKESFASYLFIGGCIVFSGSLFALVLTQQRWLGAVTPIGGVFFLLGWISLGVLEWRRKREPIED